MYALDVLGVVTLVPGARRGVLGTRVRRQRLGISTLLGAAAGSNFLGNSEVGLEDSSPHASWRPWTPSVLPVKCKGCTIR